MRRRYVIRIALFALAACAACPALDAEQPIALVPGSGWSAAQSQVLADAARCWNQAFGTRLEVTHEPTVDQRVPVRFNDFLCSYAAARVEPVPPVKVSVCRHLLLAPGDDTSFLFYLALLHELGHVVNIRDHAEDPVAVMAPSEHPDAVSRFAPEDRQLFDEANPEASLATGCDAVTIPVTYAPDDGRFNCRCFADAPSDDSQSVTTATLEGVWVSPRQTVWAVGHRGTIIHHDGRRWREIPSGTGQDLLAIWGDPAGDEDYLFAVGRRGTILHYDGSAWIRLAEGLTQADLHGVAGTVALDESANDWVSQAYAAGDRGTILRFDGTRWEVIDSGTDSHLRAVTSSFADSVWIAGDGGALLHFDHGALTSWGDELEMSADLRGITDTNRYRVWVVGRGGDSAHVDVEGEATWRAAARTSGQDLLAVVQSDVAFYPDLWAVGAGGTVRLAGEADVGRIWDTVRSGDISADLKAAWPDGQGGIWAVGTGGATRHIVMTPTEPQ